MFTTKRKYLLIILFFLLAILFTGTIFLLRGGRDDFADTQPDKMSIDTDDLLRLKIPEGIGDVWENKWVPFRPRRDKWDSREVEKYWNNTEGAIIKSLSDINELLITDILGEDN